MAYDAAMEYEKLARAVFNNCPKGKDPWGYAQQEKFDAFVPKPTQEGKRILSTILIAAILNPKYEKHLLALLKLENEVWETTKQEQVIGIIDSANKLLGLL